MKWTYLMLTLILAGCGQQEGKLSAEEITQIKNDIIKSSEKHAQDLVNLNYKEVMKFYGDVEDHILFGDGFYWGDYLSVDGIWRDFTGGVKK